MGVLWGLYCLKHKESLDVGKWNYLGSYENNVNPEIILKMRNSLNEKEPHRGPNEIWMDDRILDLISAFIQRHKNCELNIWNDVDKKLEPLLEQIGFSPDWYEFSIWEDKPYWEHYNPATEESIKRHIHKCQTQIQKLQKEIQKGNISRFRKKRIEKEIKKWEEGLKLAEESLEKKIGFISIHKIDGIDVLNEIKSMSI